MKPMQKARARMLIKHTFFGSIVMGTEMVEDRSFPTAATDMLKIFYNPDFIDSLPLDVVMFVLAHEAFHIMLKHGLRRGNRNPKLWNIACDYAINWQLKKAGFTIWEHCFCDAKYDGMSAEQIYEIVAKEDEERRKRGGEGLREDGLGGDVREPEDLTPAKRAEIEQRVREVVAQAANAARIAGQFPADLERLVEGILNPPLPWQELLREFCTRVDPSNESWRRRNRRFSDVYLPSRYDLKLGEAIIIGDTSGSMGDKVFAQIGAEINEIVEMCKPERVRVIWADDTDCALEEIFEPGEQIVLHPKGGGGTDMRKPLRYVEQFDPQFVILVTDCETPWPTSEPSYPLIVCSTTKLEAPIGVTIHV
jgi:predicted metal-dependent peptidase